MKKSICLALSFILLCVSISVTPVLAMEKNNIKSNSPSPSIEIQSTVPIVGPIAGARKSGSLQYRSTRQNLNNVGEYFYYKYTYYANSNYTKSLGSTYSYLYSIMY